MHAQTRPVETATIRLRSSQFDWHCQARKLNDSNTRADFIGVHRWTVRRAEIGGPVSERFIAKTIAAFYPLKFEDLFEVKVTVAEQIPEPARRSA